MTIIGITSNVSSYSKDLSKYTKVFMINPLNWWSCKLHFSTVGFPMRAQNFFGLSVTSLPFSISGSKLLILNFNIMLFFVLFDFFLFTFLFLFFTEKTSILVLFSSTVSTSFFIEFVFCLKMVLFLAIYTSFPRCWAFFLFHFMFMSTI